MAGDSEVEGRLDASAQSWKHVAEPSAGDCGEHRLQVVAHHERGTDSATVDVSQ